MALEAVDLEEMQKKITELSKVYKGIGEPEFTRSGSVVLDALLGGGIPKGVYILLSAEEGCGKSTVALHISKIYCMQGKRVLYLDYESGVNQSQIDGMGLRDYMYDPVDNPNGNFYLFQVQTYKDAESIFDKIMDSIDLVVIDSATAMLTEKIKESSAEDMQIGLDSRVMSSFLKKYKAESRRKGVSWFIIDQLRTKIATSYGQRTKEVAAGGKALQFYPDIILSMKKDFKGDLERTEETPTGPQKIPFGAICNIVATKNKYERPYIPLKLAIIFGRGIDNSFAYETYLEAVGGVKKGGAWYSIKINGHDDRVQGLPKVVEWINSHKEEVRNYIKDKGGYKILMNRENSVDIDSDGMEEDVYGEQVVDGDFEQGDSKDLLKNKPTEDNNDNNTGNTGNTETENKEDKKPVKRTRKSRTVKAEK